MNEILNESSYELNRKVCFINFEGKMEGEKTFGEIYELSLEEKHDLILIKENDGIPLIKMVNYGKMLYEQKKAQKKQRQNIQETKEIKFGLNIGENDFNIKIKHIKEFLEDGVKVKITVQMNGREVNYPEFALEMMDKIIEEIKDIGYSEDKKVVNGRFVSMNFNKVKENKK